MDARDVAERIGNTYEKGDVDAVGKLYTEKAVLVHPLAPAKLSGRKAIVELEATLFNAFTDINFDLRRVVDGGDVIAIEFVISATNTAPLTAPDGSPIPATGKRIELPVCGVVTVDDKGLLETDNRYLDTASFMSQLGL